MRTTHAFALVIMTVILAPAAAAPAERRRQDHVRLPTDAESVDASFRFAEAYYANVVPTIKGEVTAEYPIWDKRGIACPRRAKYVRCVVPLPGFECQAVGPPRPCSEHELAFSHSAYVQNIVEWYEVTHVRYCYAVRCSFRGKHEAIAIAVGKTHPAPFPSVPSAPEQPPAITTPVTPPAS